MAAGLTSSKASKDWVQPAVVRGARRTILPTHFAAMPTWAPGRGSHAHNRVGERARVAEASSEGMAGGEQQAA